MNEEEVIEKRLLIFLFVGFLILLATVSVVCIMYSPKTLTPSFSYAEPESEPENEKMHRQSASVRAKKTEYLTILIRILCERYIKYKL